MKPLLLLTALLVTALASAQTPSIGRDLTVKGKFYAVVDDGAVVFLNGTEVFQIKLKNGEMQESQEVTLKAGDRLTMQLSNKGGGKFLRLLFMATDRSVMLPVTHRAFKCLPDGFAKDFTEADWQRNQKVAKEIRDRTTESFPIKSKAEYLWGDGDVCAIGGVLTREMFVAVPAK
jgi:hypothetical protein